ncbi:MAG: electron transport complex subunit RsxB [Nitrosospira sp.]|nr:electron transport complex subunit RsxB [Nitrosospira sp.]
MRRDILIERIDSILPQTQCRQCGFLGCMPYAEAIAAGSASINQCPPGGEAGIQQLADLLGINPIPLNAANGMTKPKAVALIDEQDCIGCTLCIDACPVDAIVGAAKQMHTVIEAECTGCELCLAPCPVDCIRMTPPTKLVVALESSHSILIENGSLNESEVKKRAADHARERYQFRLLRLDREEQEQVEKFAQKTVSASSDSKRASMLPTLKRTLPHQSDG